MDKYMKEYEITSYECNAEGELRLRALFNLFQDMADTHADNMGLGYHYCIQRGIGWIGGGYHVHFHRLPRWGERVRLSTWPSAATAATGIRDFQMTTETGEVLVNASSQWVLVDLKGMRPIPVKKHIPQYELVDEHALLPDFSPLEAVETPDSLVEIPVRFDDIDINQHVNNGVYPSLLQDAFPPDFWKTHQLKELKILFKLPAKAGDVMRLESAFYDTHSLHQMLHAQSGRLLARARMTWQTKKD